MSDSDSWTLVEYDWDPMTGEATLIYQRGKEHRTIYQMQHRWWTKPELG